MESPDCREVGDKRMNRSRTNLQLTAKGGARESAAHRAIEDAIRIRQEMLADARFTRLIRK